MFRLSVKATQATYRRPEKCENASDTIAPAAVHQSIDAAPKHCSTDSYVITHSLYEFDCLHCSSAHRLCLGAFERAQVDSSSRTIYMQSRWSGGAVNLSRSFFLSCCFSCSSCRFAVNGIYLCFFHELFNFSVFCNIFNVFLCFQSQKSNTCEEMQRLSGRLVLCVDSYVHSHVILLAPYETMHERAAVWRVDDCINVIQISE